MSYRIRPSIGRTGESARRHLVGRAAASAGRVLYSRGFAPEEISMTFGVIVGNRGFFPGPPGAERPRGDDRGARSRRATQWLPRARGDQARRRRNARRRPRAAPICSGSIATRSTASSSRCRISATSAPSPIRLRLADLNVPVLVQATPDTPGKMTIATAATASAARCRPAIT